MAKKLKLSTESLDEIAAREGFVFARELRLGNRLYQNNEGVNRIYTSSGDILNEYTPVSAYRFHNPISCSGSRTSTPALTQYKGSKTKKKRRIIKKIEE